MDTPAPSITLSVVIPLRNEEANIRQLYEQVSQAMKPLDQRGWELILIDDGSTDGTRRMLKALREKDPRVRWFFHKKSQGQSAALAVGFRQARGEFIGTLDGDLQNPPGELPRLLAFLEANNMDMVSGRRAKRRDNALRKIASKIGNGARRMVTGDSVQDVGCSLRVFRRACLRDVWLFKNFHRFFPTLFMYAGFRLTDLPVEHRPRAGGTTNYTTLKRLADGIFDLVGVYWLRKRWIRLRLAHTGEDSDR